MSASFSAPYSVGEGRSRLRRLAEEVDPAAEACREPPKGKRWGGEALAEQWYVLVTCRDEKQQAELLTRFKAEGLTCKAVLS